MSMLLRFVVNSMMFPFEKFNVATLPSSGDKRVVENMTSWITNDTIKMYVYAHLLYCPNQDMCFGEEYQRKVSFSNTKLRSCSFCDCNDKCHRKKNCCPWRNYKQNISTSPEFITYVNHSYSSRFQYDTVALDCISPSITLLLKQKYFMVSECPSSFVDEVTLKKCRNPEKETELKLYQPVTSIKTNFSKLVLCDLQWRKFRHVVILGNTTQLQVFGRPNDVLLYANPQNNAVL